mmetsp:Transcript_57604/g.131973  ORF Transcript_57604/g.131973 Transcript_57604/m.131973 type:complete len:181 (+) Transcript_57604:153-695(+)
MVALSFDFSCDLDRGWGDCVSSLAPASLLGARLPGHPVDVRRKEEDTVCSLVPVIGDSLPVLRESLQDGRREGAPDACADSPELTRSAHETPSVGEVLLLLSGSIWRCAPPEIPEMARLMPLCAFEAVRDGNWDPASLSSGVLLHPRTLEPVEDAKEELRSPRCAGRGARAFALEAAASH